MLYYFVFERVLFLRLILLLLSGLNQFFYGFSVKMLLQSYNCTFLVAKWVRRNYLIIRKKISSSLSLEAFKQDLRWNEKRKQKKTIPPFRNHYCPKHWIRLFLQTDTEISKTPLYLINSLLCRRFLFILGYYFPPISYRFLKLMLYRYRNCFNDYGKFPSFLLYTKRIYFPPAFIYLIFLV